MMKKPLRNFLPLALLTLFLVNEAYAQPSPITDVPAFSSNFTSIGNLVFFTAGDGLYRTDATDEGTLLLKQNIFVLHFLEFKNELYFVAEGPGETMELWKSDGTPGGTVSLAGFRDITIMGQTDDYLFFAASLDDTGRELYRTDGTAGGTIHVRDINPGPESGIPDARHYTSLASTVEPFPATILNNEIYFPADDGTHGKELWKSNGTAAGTEMILDINPGADDGVASTLPVTFEDAVYFTGITSAHGQEPWITNGTAAGTHLLGETIAGAVGSDRIDFVSDLEGTLYFASYWLDPFDLEQYDLWETQGSSESTSLVETLCQFCAFDSLFHMYNGNLYFFTKGSIDNQFWRTDGTAPGTEQLYEERLDGGIAFLEEINNQMIFYTVSQGNNIALERSDGATVTRLWNIRAGQSGDLISMAKVNDLLFFSDHTIEIPGYPTDPDDAFQLMQTDGFTVEPLRDLYGTSYNETRNVTNYQGKVLFTRGELDEQMTLWIYDPSDDEGASFTIVNADSNEDIQRINSGDTFAMTPDLNINIRYNPEGSPGSVVFKHNGVSVRRENEAPFALRGDYSGDYLVWEGAIAGEHTVEAIPYSGPNATGERGPSLTVTFTITDGEACMASGEISYEKWEGISGNEVYRIPVNTNADHTQTLTAFEAPSNQGTNYGSRVRGYLCVPQTGSYVFWIASNDHSELWLSTDDQPENKVKIAWLTRATNPQEWNKFSTQRSTSIWLEAGQRYYIEALHKQGIGTDHLAVGWQLPDGSMERPIPGTRLSPFEGIPEASSVVARQAIPESDASYAEINVYPNPAPAGTVELFLEGGHMDMTRERDVSVVNMAGDVVFSARMACNNGNCDTQRIGMDRQLPAGLYVIKIKSGDRLETRRLLVK